ncbi:MAG: hypothetical protein LBG07_03385 [Treponema sp.]|jgi:uncharacterized protein (DUF2141 family)|nr:hypothetical protein [Treponema sp.]
MRNKKTVVVAVLLLALVGVGIVFAAEGVSISRTSTTLTVKNDTNKNVSGDVCINLKRPGTDWTGEYWFSFSLRPYGSTTYRADGGVEISGYSDVACKISE